MFYKNLFYLACLQNTEKKIHTLVLFFSRKIHTGMIQSFVRRITLASTTKGRDSSPEVEQAAKAEKARHRSQSTNTQQVQKNYEKLRAEELNKLSQLEVFASPAANKTRKMSTAARLNVLVQKSKRQQLQTQEVSRMVDRPVELSEVLSNPFLRQLFRSFLQTRFASENLMFFETSEFFNSVSNTVWRTKMAEGIMEQFVLDGSIYNVNLSSQDRADLMAHYKTQFWPTGSFDMAQRELYELMNFNFFISFCDSCAPWPLDASKSINLLQRDRGESFRRMSILIEEKDEPNKSKRLSTVKQIQEVNIERRASTLISSLSDRCQSTNGTDLIPTINEESTFNSLATTIIEVGRRASNLFAMMTTTTTA
jgi:hypothetical protein